MSHLVGPSKALIEHPKPGSISSFTMQAPASVSPSLFYTPGAGEITDLMTFINNSRVKTVNLSNCVLSERATDALVQGLMVIHSPVESLIVQAKGLGKNITNVFLGIGISNRLEFFEARGSYACDGQSSLNELSVKILADAVSSSRTLMRVRLDQIGIEEEHRSIILRPYEKIGDRQLADIKIAGFVNGAQYPEHPQVNTKDFVDRAHLKPEATPQGCAGPKNR